MLSDLQIQLTWLNQNIEPPTCSYIERASRNHPLDFYLPFGKLNMANEQWIPIWRCIPYPIPSMYGIFTYI